MYWILVLVILANVVAVSKSPHPILWLVLLGTLWGHLIIQHLRVTNKNYDVRTVVAWSTFILVILCNIVITLALGGVR